MISANLFYLREYDRYLCTIAENNLIWRVKKLCGAGNLWIFRRLVGADMESAGYYDVIVEKRIAPVDGAPG